MRMRFCGICLCAVVFFKCAVGIGIEPAAAQDGNLQADLESSIPKTDIQEAPEVTTVIPEFTSEEPKTTGELIADVVGVVRRTQDKIERARGRSTLSVPSPTERRALTDTNVTSQDMSVLIENLLPTRERSRALAATSAEYTVLSITRADIEKVPRQNLLNVVRASKIPDKKSVFHPARTVSTGRKTALSASLPVGHTFRSNALRSNINRQEDWVFASGPNVLLVVPMFAKDNITASAGTTSRRFARLSGSNRDIGNGLVRYTHVRDKSIGGPTSEEGLAFEANTIVSWDEGITGKPTSFSGPSLTWFLYKLPLGSQKCGTAKPVQCYTLDIETSTSYTWSNIPALDNGAIGGSVKVTRVIPEHNLTLTGKVGLTGNLYSNEREDRIDGGISLNGSIGWQMRPETRLSAGVSYGYNRSTISQNDWDGYDLLPSINFSTALGEW